MKCARCKGKNVEFIMKANGTQSKTCIKCLESGKKYRQTHEIDKEKSKEYRDTHKEKGNTQRRNKSKKKRMGKNTQRTKEGK